MKMKSIAVAILAAFMVVQFTGCAGVTKHPVEKDDDGNFTWGKEVSEGFMQPMRLEKNTDKQIYNPRIAGKYVATETDERERTQTHEKLIGIITPATIVAGGLRSSRSRVNNNSNSESKSNSESSSKADASSSVKN